MTKKAAVQVQRVLPTVGKFTVSEADAILEVAYLTTAADGRLSEEEYESFRDVASKLRGMAAGTTGVVSDQALNKLFERYAQRIDHAERSERLKALRGALERMEARELAYKVAFAMAICDLETSDEEADFDDELIEALDLAEARADVLAGEVYAALDDSGEDEEGAS